MTSVWARCANQRRPPGRKNPTSIVTRGCKTICAPPDTARLTTEGKPAAVYDATMVFAAVAYVLPLGNPRVTQTCLGSMSVQLLRSAQSVRSIA